VSPTLSSGRGERSLLAVWSCDGSQEGSGQIGATLLTGIYTQPNREPFKGRCCRLDYLNLHYVNIFAAAIVLVQQRLVVSEELKPRDTFLSKSSHCEPTPLKVLS
jgi:hypothetical protein